MGKVREFAERLWSGAVSTEVMNPVTTTMGFEAIEEGLGFISGFANVTALDTSEGLVLIDTGSFLTGIMVHQQLRSWSQRPLHTAIFTHGHVDHVFGVQHFERDPIQAAHGPARVVAHEAVAARFERYKMTAGYNTAINARQFRLPGIAWPTQFRAPDLTYRDRLALEIGGEALELNHARGETDDHTWVWVPGRRLLCTGDLFIWAVPNCGNPQKVQRYPLEWAAALRRMEALGAETLLPGHGPPIFGSDRVRQALGDTAELLESICAQTLEMMNAGAALIDILHAVEAPAALLDKPYLRPIYDEPQFIVRNLWRLYGGWYEGNPAHLTPAHDRAIAAEIAALAGGAEALIARAEALAEAGDLPLACHLAQLAGDAGADPAIRARRSAIYAARAAAEPSLMARGIFADAAEG